MLLLEGLELQVGGFRLSADLSVQAGARVAVIGPSGAGKSTLLSAIAGYQPTTKGRVTWAGRDITGDEPGARPLSIVFQDNNLFPHLTVAQNVGLGLSPSLRLSADQQERVADSLARVGLPGLGDRKPAQLSGGQQSRVALARVLLRARPLMLLDEPFAALGPALKAEMLDLVKEVAAETGAAVLMVTHDPDDARRLGGQTILVDGGRAEAPQDTDALLADPPPGLRAYLRGDGAD
ncbi:MAG: ATP-binding cassette domain-containing protein [Rhodobacter sp.]|nr:ATP-binding cassette domain-containing protein [Rhodobacter sp.]